MTDPVPAGRLLAVLILVFVARPLLAQRFPVAAQLEVTPGLHLLEVDNVTRSHLERFHVFLSDQQWDEAVDALQGVMDSATGALIQIDGGTNERSNAFVRYIPFRQYCHLLLARLADEKPEALQLYRHRVDPLARRWYERALQQNDADLYGDIVDLFFVSSYGDDALFRLGEVELERGHFTEARLAWERLSPLLRASASAADAPRRAAGNPLWLSISDEDIQQRWSEHHAMLTEPAEPARWLAYPDTDIDLAAVRARLVLVSMLEGSFTRARRELEILRRLDSEAEGVIAGRRGRYVDTLTDLLQRSEFWSPEAAAPDWGTFGGSASRAKIAPEPIDIALQSVWSVGLPRRMAEDLLPQDEFRAAEDREGLLSYHPVIASGMVLLATGDRIDDVNAYDLHTGAPLWPQGRSAAENHDTDTRPQVGLGHIYPSTYVGVPRFTMTAHDATLYVKLGLQATSFPLIARQLPPEPGFLAALDLTAQKKRLFEIHVDQAPWETGWALEGAPVTDGRYLYTAMRRRDNLRAQAHVACFDKKRGRLRWRTFVAAADTLGQGRSLEYTHNLLALDQGTLYFNTNLGAVAALRAEDGRITWLMRYPRAPIGGEDAFRSQRHVYRDVTPCLVHHDLVFVAPGDCDRVFALDAGTGILLWATAPQTGVDVVHLLGVGHGNLIASGSRLYWFDVGSGQVKASYPGRLEDSLRGYGRGLLAGDWIYWPTRDGIHVFDQRGPRPVRQPIDLAPLGITGGNLATSDDVLIIAGSDRMTAFSVHGPRVTHADGQP